MDGPAVTTPVASPPDPRAKAREDAGVGIGLADDLRALRTALVKAHLAGDFEAAFDLVVFQMVRAVFARGYTTSWHALDIACNETADRPAMRMNDDDFAAWSPGEAMLADWSHLPFEWMEGDDDAACFAALRALPRADKEKLFAAAVARTVKGQLAFEHDARPELEATVARLGIDFAKHVRPTAGMLWSRIRKSRNPRHRPRDLRRRPGPRRGRSTRRPTSPRRWRRRSPPASARSASARPSTPPPRSPGPCPGSRRSTRAARRVTVPKRKPPSRPPTPPTHPGMPSPIRCPGDTGAAGPPANGNGHGAPVHEEAEAGAEPANGDGASEEEVPAEPAVAEAIDAMNRVPTADGGPRVTVRTVGPVNGGDDPSPEGTADDMPEVPEFLRRVH